jgi:DNA-binding NarL/FixJ family response regulator
VGYLLKERVSTVVDFVSAIERVAVGGTVVDPAVITQLVRLRQGPLERLSPREREVLALITEGRTNAGLAKQLFINEAAVNKHIGNIFNKLDLPVDTEGHRRSSRSSPSCGHDDAAAPSVREGP